MVAEHNQKVESGAVDLSFEDKPITTMAFALISGGEDDHPRSTLRVCSTQETIALDCGVSVHPTQVVHTVRSDSGGVRDKADESKAAGSLHINRGCDGFPVGDPITRKPLSRGGVYRGPRSQHDVLRIGVEAIKAHCPPGLEEVHMAGRCRLSSVDP